MNCAGSKGAGRRGPAAALAWEIWSSQRVVFCAVLGALLVGACGRLASPPKRSVDDLFGNVCLVLMGMSLAALFILFRFTESDRRQRFTGFPARLFTLPVRTTWLVTWPMLLGAGTLVVVYVGWGALLIPREARFLGFPSLYLATGMICFQSIVWSLAAFPITRLVVLGVWGTALTTSWIAFSPTMGQAQLGADLARALHVSVRTAQMGILGTISLAAYGLACWSVERQRRGVTWKFRWPRLGLVRLVESWLPARGQFASPRAAQFWFEWRRNGMALPLVVGVLLLVIVTPFFALRPFSGRAEAGTVALTLFWIMVLPFALAFIIGQGFGKTNLRGQGLGKELGVPLFVAVRPLRAADWLAVKLKAAALSAVLTWLIVAAVVLPWLLICCDFGPLVSVVFWATPLVWLMVAVPLLVLLLGLAMLLTWRLLVANLYLGVLASRALLNIAFCVVFATLFVGMVFGAWLYHERDALSELAKCLPWVERGLMLLVLLKFGLAGLWLCRARAGGLLPRGAALNYFVFWIWGTALLLLLALVAPVTDNAAGIVGLLALLALPLARISLALLVFARSRVQ